MADDRDAMMRELESEVRREQMAKLWDRYGVYVIAVVALLIVGVGGFKWWEARSLAAAETAGARYQAAVQLAEAGKGDEARQAFEAMARDAPSGYAALARLQLAGEAAAAGKTADALAAYEGIAGDGSVDLLLRQYAQLQSAALKVDTADFTEMKNRLTPLLAENNAWRFSARELLGLSAYRAGRLEESRQVFLELAADQKTPPSVRERAGLFMGLITSAEAQRAAPPAQPAAGTPPAETPKVQ
ncbi:MAG: tetratricopeptide repeat protein [Hyphomicrobiaceae bacterium]|nr:tetratricopeptide repeat protein [Hyphomicrobiaceae bacterium]